MASSPAYRWLVTPLELPKVSSVAAGVQDTPDPAVRVTVTTPRIKTRTPDTPALANGRGGDRKRVVRGKGGKCLSDWSSDVCSSDLWRARHSRSSGSGDGHHAADQNADAGYPGACERKAGRSEEGRSGEGWEVPK